MHLNIRVCVSVSSFICYNNLQMMRRHLSDGFISETAAQSLSRVAALSSNYKDGNQASWKTHSCGQVQRLLPLKSELFRRIL